MGYVCPVCLGMRFMRHDVPMGHPEFAKLFRCAGCCEGNQVNSERQLRTVTAYLRDFIAARETAG